MATSAQAITVADVKGLTRAGASDAIILSKIEVDQTIFRLTVDEILELKEFGVSDAVITYMINTGKWADEAAPEPDPQPVEDSEGIPDYDTSNIDLDSDYSGGLDSRYRSDLTVSFGYYYPHWPGYWWSTYYDPFYWTSWSYYYSYWTPYPYGYWYYDPWYRVRPGVYRYYPYDHYYYGEGRYLARRDGRHSGNRGDMVGGDRRFKNPPGGNDQASRAKDQFRGDRRVKDPSPGIAPMGPDSRVQKPERPTRRQIQPPRTPNPPVREEKPARPSRPSVNKRPATPRPNVEPQRPAKPDSRNVKPTPSRPQRQEVQRPSPPPAPRPSASPPRAPSKPSPSSNRGSTRRSKGGDR
jgi:hypothetical protein